MANTNDTGERYEPKRWLTKQDALRHLIHASIRLIFCEEDPFATHLMAQSAEKVLIDLLKRAEIDDPYSFEQFLVPKHKKEFFEIYRGIYNFLKHADKDHNDKIPIYGIVRVNDFLILGCVVRYQRLFGDLTTHMQRFLTLCFVSYPDLIKWSEASQILVPRTELAALGQISRGEFLETMRLAVAQDSAFLNERNNDLIDIGEAKTGRARS